MRALATIRTVKELKPIQDADRIEVCTMEDIGWEVVVQKGVFKKGDKVVYFEIDSVLPEEERYEFLRKSSFKEWKKGDKSTSGFKLSTIRLRGVISQGLVIGLNEFPEIKEAKEGDDVTEALKVRLYDDIKASFKTSRGVSSSGSAKDTKKSVFPGFLRKTDQQRIQNLINYFETMKDTPFVAEQKYDGSSMTVFYADPKKYKTDEAFGVCSRNLRLPEYSETKTERLINILSSIKLRKGKVIKTLKYAIKDFLKVLLFPYERKKSDSNFWKAAEKTGIKEALTTFCKEQGRSLAVQGELVGPKMNGNRDKYEDLEWFVFDVFDIDKQAYLRHHDRQTVITTLNALIKDENKKLKTVRTIKNDWNVFNDLTTLEDMLKYVDMKTERGNPQEGVVFKSLDPSKPYVSFKCINNNYLLAYKDEDNEDMEE